MSDYVEKILPDDYPVHLGYYYLIRFYSIGEEPVKANLSGTVADLKDIDGVEYVKSCDVVGRDLI